LNDGNDDDGFVFCLGATDRVDSGDGIWCISCVAILREARQLTTDQQEDKAVSELFVVLTLLTIGVVVYLTTVVIEFIWNHIKDFKNEMQSL
jgi:uncharacterized membrane protein